MNKRARADAAGRAGKLIDEGSAAGVMISQRCLESRYDKYVQLLNAAETEQQVLEVIRMLNEVNRKLDEV